MKKRSSQFILNLALIIYTGLIHSLSSWAADDIRWPMPDWQSLDTNARMESLECRNFKKLAVASDQFLTDGLIIIKDGLIHYEYYDSLHGPHTPHVLWSISKTITASLLGISERDGRINLDDQLREFYPLENSDHNYDKITLKNLLYMDSGYIWNEGIKEVNLNPLVKMLFGQGHKDMASFALSRKIIKQGPTYQWNYSSGTSTITMGVLKKIYGSDDEQMPWRNLFNPLGMRSAVFERDISGTFIGGSSAFTTPRDLAKIGYLYLNNGVWNGEVLLPAEWIQKMLTPSPGYLSPGTIITDVTKDGVYGGSIWLNKETKKGKGKPYPNVPEDMYLAIGYMGQLLVVIPSLKMIIVRTGHDQEYHSKLNEFLSRAIQCFHDPKHVIGKSKAAGNPLKMSLGKLIRNVKNAISANTLQASMAKTICSCHYISGQEIPSCVKRNNFSLSRFLTKITVRETKELNGEMSIQVRLSRFARLFKLDFSNSAKAYYNPLKSELGCTLK